VWENLLYILGEYRATRSQHVYLGRLIQNYIPHGYTSGGAGYVISKPAVRRIVDEGPRFPANCRKDGQIEDYDIGRYGLLTQISQHNFLFFLCFGNCWVTFKQVLPKVIWEEPRRHLSRQRMDSPAACTSYTLPTANETNHSAAGMLHPHLSATFFLYVTLCCLIPPHPEKIAPSCWEISNPTGNKKPS